MLRPSPNHGTQRLPNDDDDDLLLELMHGTDLYGARGTAILFVAFFQSEKEVIQQKDRCILGENGDSCNIMGYMSS